TWLSFHEFILKRYTSFDQHVIEGLITVSEYQLHILQVPLEDLSRWNKPFKRHLAFDGAKAVTVGAPCDGVVLYALFICFILAFPGRVKHKIWFIPLGVLFLFWVNSLRIISLAWIMSVNESWLEFNHDYTFTILVYSLEFLLWTLWVRFLSPVE
ncbi:MAG: hypothetical protein ACKOW8_13150, partial [Flavobacteriales bacterium]